MDIQVVLNQMIILFLVMIIGYIANKTKMLDKDLNQKLSTFVLNITSPALILSSVANPIQGDFKLVIQMALVSVVVYLILPFIGIIFVKFLRIPRQDRNLYQFMTIFSNVGFMGYPVVQAIFGTQALFFAAICNLVFNVVCFSYGVFLISGEENMSFDIKKIINPGIIFSILAVIIYITKWQMPSILAETSTLVGSITTPLAMMIIGSSLAEIPLKEVVSDARIYVFTIIKQIFMPIIFWLILRNFITNNLVLGVSVVLQAMPIASITLMFSNQYGGNTSLASKSIFITTLASVFTIPTLVYILFV